MVIIPGAKLEEPLESHTVSKLRWWLLNTSMTKDQLIARYLLFLILNDLEYFF